MEGSAWKATSACRTNQYQIKGKVDYEAHEARGIEFVVDMLLEENYRPRKTCLIGKVRPSCHAP